MKTTLQITINTPTEIDIESVYEVFEEIFHSTETEVDIIEDDHEIIEEDHE